MLISFAITDNNFPLYRPLRTYNSAYSSVPNNVFGLSGFTLKRFFNPTSHLVLSCLLLKALSFFIKWDLGTNAFQSFVSFQIIGRVLFGTAWKLLSVIANEMSIPLHELDKIFLDGVTRGLWDKYANLSIIAKSELDQVMKKMNYCNSDSIISDY